MWRTEYRENYMSGAGSEDQSSPVGETGAETAQDKKENAATADADPAPAERSDTWFSQEAQAAAGEREVGLRSSIQYVLSCWMQPQSERLAREIQADMLRSGMVFYCAS